MLKKVEDFVSNHLIIEIEKELSVANNNMIIFGLLSILGIGITMVLARTIAFTILIDVASVRTGVENFFAFINFEKDDIKLIKIDSKDELGMMSKIINENIENTKANIKKDRALIADTIRVANEINKGHLNVKIELGSNNPALNELKDIINEMLGTLNTNITNILRVLTSYSKFDFRPKLAENDLEGIIKELEQDINVLRDVITNMLVENKNIGLTLSQNAMTLSTNMQNIAHAANSQAASLEETAASLEEITSNITNNTQTTSKMASYGEKVKESIKVGQELANKTVASMEEINKQALAINEAISVIDQIAFQTNILSLNAAVEAATAGEAGKGFAVVAGEVRNLATRSADAANEIKKIVEAATLKAKNGKTITSNMIEGFNELKENIDTTIKLIEDVATASKEQQQAMSQINDTVNSLDQATQKNAILATTINDMATKTSQLAVSLDETIHQTSFDKDAHKRICDGSMIIEINKLKSDHINFKNYNFSVCKEGEISTVTGSKECNLGKWMAANANEEFAKTNEWQILIESHNLVHKLMQDTIVLYSESKPNSDIFAVTNEIEKHTDIVFDMLNRIREINCQNLQN